MLVTLQNPGSCFAVLHNHIIIESVFTNNSAD